MTSAEPSTPARALAGRIALAVEYDGGAYSGWQLQHHADTVQARLEAALGRVAAEPVRVHCAGRTDAGVHAEGQVVHFDTRAERSPRSWVLGTNSNLPDDIAVRWAQAVAPGFHARFSATGRHYRYVILCRPTRSALWRGRAVWTHKTLDLARMRTAGGLLVGRHDFTSFRALACQAKSPVRTLRYLHLERQGDLITLALGADGFLHHMVRNIAGVLMAIGSGEAPVAWTAELLAVRNRALGGVTAPPHGLYLTGVDYPADFGLPGGLSAGGDAAGPPVL
ncbi:tRNA pseudouridine(38-40) synthase TruA [Thiohalocapsa halophila]|uniref:tRNA pseudouridine synthase A n=1 Tax=Thiohalocapsa halophila TaxID=69359 RepID=A0ABS1CLD7_9GAMM|nr:tRNA pseudouridine(38-40) synthase TruA [Thiohalocapsa halophila]MBK1632732.1 tRNA pseudouridine(38-40) synthase TruA [Thiohalocapsa halophila]